MAGPRYLFLNTLALVIAGGVFLLLVFSALGAFDPGPRGQLIWEEQLPSVRAGAGATAEVWLNAPIPEVPFTLSLTARHGSGERDAGYGVMLGQGKGKLVVAVSPLGYVAIWKQDSLEQLEPAEYLLNWQTWPHVNSANLVNELSIEEHGDKVTVRLNREWLWEGSGFTAIDRIGLISKSFGAETTADFGRAALFAPRNGWQGWEAQ